MLHPNISKAPQDWAPVSASANGVNQVIAAVSAKSQIRVISGFLMAAGTVTAQWQSGPTSAANLSGVLPLVANSIVPMSESMLGHFQTRPGDDLQLNLSGAVAVTGWITYQVIGSDQRVN